MEREYRKETRGKGRLRGISGIAFIMLLLQLSVINGLATNFTDNGDGTVTDSGTELMWQQGDDGIERNWGDALSHCEGLSLAGYSDWKLPDIKELESITIDTATADSPSIDTTFFPNANLLSYWSATTTAESAAGAWYVSFSNGGWVFSYLKTYIRYVRCVR